MYCKSENAKAIEKFNFGIEILNLNHDLKPKYLAINTTIFFDALKIDKTFCDAYFFVGYTLRLQNKLDLALKYYEKIEHKDQIPKGIKELLVF